MRQSASLIRNAIGRALSTSAPSSASAAVGTKEHIDGLVKSDKVVVFMKGTADKPQCGFSNAVVQILKFHEVPFTAHNVMASDSLREGIKEYSNWPTIPQIYVNKEFVGGCDILIQMHKNGELIDKLAAAGIKSALVDKPDKKIK